ncbi:hypothetical protein NQ318_022980 [Aromia moschata]|uniref:Uncharacterized protein n=1 Tax=Aromia moschata TaxID=1265417 RepID=A0AAV8YCQ1_9CUCU|nr:hypothetical protein NQ318_022980 [Aromia moschata]
MREYCLCGIFRSTDASSESSGEIDPAVWRAWLSLAGRSRAELWRGFGWLGEMEGTFSNRGTPAAVAYGLWLSFGHIGADMVLSRKYSTFFKIVLGGKTLSELDLDELDELEDSEDEAVLEEYRRKRIAEIKALTERQKFGTVGEISAQDYVNEVNKAGEGIWVVLHLYKQGNLPTIFVYFEGELKKQIAGPLEFRGPNLTQDELEYILGKTGAIETDIKEDPRPKIKDKLFSDLAETNDW